MAVRACSRRRQLHNYLKVAAFCALAPKCATAAAYDVSPGLWNEGAADQLQQMKQQQPQRSGSVTIRSCRVGLVEVEGGGGGGGNVFALDCKFRMCNSVQWFWFGLVRGSMLKRQTFDTRLHPDWDLPFFPDFFSRLLCLCFSLLSLFFCPIGFMLYHRVLNIGFCEPHEALLISKINRNIAEYSNALWHKLQTSYETGYSLTRAFGSGLKGGRPTPKEAPEGKKKKKRKKERRKREGYYAALFASTGPMYATIRSPLSSFLGICTRVLEYV